MNNNMQTSSQEDAGENLLVNVMSNLF